jgi:hypothetical protein
LTVTDTSVSFPDTTKICMVLSPLRKWFDDENISMMESSAIVRGPSTSVMSAVSSMRELFSLHAALNSASEETGTVVGTAQFEHV